MRVIAALLAGLVAAVALCAFVVGNLGDRDLLTSPPDAVAEGFAREIVTGRFDQAEAYLLEPASDDEAQMRALESSIVQRLGHVDDVGAKLIDHTSSDAVASVTLHSAKGSESLPVQLRFSSGEWKLKEIPRPLRYLAK